MHVYREGKTFLEVLPQQNFTKQLSTVKCSMKLQWVSSSLTAEIYGDVCPPQPELSLALENFVQVLWREAGRRAARASDRARM